MAKKAKKNTGPEYDTVTPMIRFTNVYTKGGKQIGTRQVIAESAEEAAKIPYKD